MELQYTLEHKHTIQIYDMVMPDGHLEIGYKIASTGTELSDLTKTDILAAQLAETFNYLGKNVEKIHE